MALLKNIDTYRYGVPFKEDAFEEKIVSLLGSISLRDDSCTRNLMKCRCNFVAVFRPTCTYPREVCGGRKMYATFLKRRAKRRREGKIVE